MGFIIDKIKIFTLICDKCKYKTRVQLAGVRSIRKYGWQLSKDKRCYCPTCRTDKKANKEESKARSKKAD